MPNGDMNGGEFRGGGLGYGFRQAGVSESKQVNVQTEERIPLAQALAIFMSTLILLFFGYICAKLLITSRGDWSLLIGIVSIPSFPLLSVAIERKIIKRYFPRVYADFLALSSRALLDESFRMRLLYYFLFAIPILVILGFYIHIIVPAAIVILDSQAHIVFVFCAFIAVIVAWHPYYVFNKRQLVDSLRDSDYHYASEALKIENENRWKRVELEKEVLSLPSADPKVPAGYFSPVMFRANPDATPTAFSSDAQKRWRDAVSDFLDGIDGGKWGTGEKSWRSDPIEGVKWLKKSRYKLMDMASVIRDELIDHGWGRWKNANDRSAGWELLFSTDEIRNGAFREGTSMLDVQNEGNNGSENDRK